MREYVCEFSIHRVAHATKNGVEFRQQTNSDNKTGVATSCDVARRRRPPLTRCDRSDSVFFRLSHPERGGLENTLSDLSHPVRGGLTFLCSGALT